MIECELNVFTQLLMHGKKLTVLSERKVDQLR